MAKKALISKAESRESGFRVAQVENASDIFEVGSGLEWIDCPDDLKADAKWYDETSKSFKDFPVIEIPEPVAPTKEELMTQLLNIQKEINKL